MSYLIESRVITRILKSGRWRQKKKVGKRWKGRNKVRVMPRRDSTMCPG